jgi:8-oxo-dGTP pyrophosphatase MutT (NUDIX family)
MTDVATGPEHHIQRYILEILRHTEFARFRDLKPPKVESNVFNYHLSQLMRVRLVTKSAAGYTLSLSGIAYIDRVSRLDTRPRIQPKIMTITALYNELGEVLMYKKLTQPMINQLTFPTGMLHMEDHTIREAALREVYEKTGITLDDVTHVGDCYMAVRNDGTAVMNALMHVFVAEVTKSRVDVGSGALWYDPRKGDDSVAPATAHLLERLAHREPDKLFFEEYSIDW